MKKNFILLFLSLTIQLGCGSKVINSNILPGFWINEINDASGNQKFVLYFNEEKESLECRFHSYFNGMKFSSEPGSDINFNGESLSFVANKLVNVRYEGKVDSVNRMIIGKLKYADGSEREFNLKKISKEKLVIEFPGLYNLTKETNLFEQPKGSNDGWDIGTLIKNEIDSTLLQKMIDSINYGRFGKVHSV